MKTFYVFYQGPFGWTNYTDVSAKSASDAVDRCQRELHRRHDGCRIRAFKNNRLPWGAR